LIDEAAIITKSNEDESDSETDEGLWFSNHVTGVSIGANRYDVVADLRSHITLLMNLLPSLQHLLDYHSRKAATFPKASGNAAFQASQAADPYISIVREKFPQANEELVKRLGQANWQRHQAIRKMMSEQLESNEDEIATANSVFQPISMFHDSGLGTSMATPTVASHSSFRTSATEGGLGSLRVPDTPAEVDLGKPFKCEICSKRVTKVKNRYHWKYAPIKLKASITS
jgi:hypothetical protein